MGYICCSRAIQTVFMGNFLNDSKLWLLIPFWLLILPAGLANSGKYPIKNFAPSDYGAGIQNIDFAQNRDLSLFVANNLGVLSFNGTTWGKHALNTGKKQRSLAFDVHSNRLYVGSQGDFGFFEDDWRYKSLLNKIPAHFQDFDEVWNVLLFESRVYFCTFQGIYVYDGDSVSVIRRPGGFNRSFLAGNRLFTQSPTGDLYEIKGRELIALQKNSDRNQVVAGVIRTEAGYLVFYNSGKIELLNSSGSTEPFTELSTALIGKFINHVLPIADGRLVIATQRAGLFIYDPLTNQIDNISVSDGLISNACLKVYQDHSGNLWVGMQNGIALIDINSPLRLINQNIELQGSGYEAFDTEEGTYYTTSNGIYFLPKNETRSQFLVGTEGPAYGLQVINFKLYAGHHTGLFLLEKGKAIRRATCDGLWQVKQLQSNPTYAIGGTYSGLHLFKLDANGALQAVQKINGFNESSRFFEEDGKGRIWVGQYYKGLYLLTLNDSLLEADTKKVSDAYNLPIQQYIFLSRIDDQLYISTAKGIFKLDQATDKIVEETVFTKVVGKNWVYQLVQDKQKNVFIYSENLVGLFKQISPGNYVYVPSSLFQLRQSFNNDLLNVSRNILNGVLFNANEGFIHYNPELEEETLITNEPLVSKVFSVAEDSVLYSRKPFEVRPEKVNPIRITEGTKVLQFVIESFKFKDVSNQQFRYFLTGFDTEYGAWTTSGVKEYTNLKVGTYTFQVQTFNSRGEVITGKPLQIEVTPSFYKSPLARVVYVVIALFILYQLYRFQRQYYRNKQTKLEQARQKELAQKQTELQELKEEQIKRELSHVNSLLATSTMNLVVKNEFMENIKEEIRQAKATDIVQDKQRALERIIKEIDTTLKVQEDWKQFEHHFDRVHGDFLKRLTTEFTDLTPGEQKLCAFLRLNMDTKEIANLMAISPRGVEIARYRLRKKFRLETHQNLSKFILEY
jgi:ligand-binding sensor domain-containing protein/DNA-binding CsgD family transcriptional regulator